jgi:hypothetical protein
VGELAKLAGDCCFNLGAGVLLTLDEAGVPLGERKDGVSMLSRSCVLIFFLADIIECFTLVAVPFFIGAADPVFALEGAGRFWPITGAGVEKGSADDALEPVTEGSLFRALVSLRVAEDAGIGGGGETPGGSSGITVGSTGIPVAGSTITSMLFSGSKVCPGWILLIWSFTDRRRVKSLLQT